MNIAILGHGKEGQAVEKYFTEQGSDIRIFDNFTLEELKSFQLNHYDMVFRSPSIRPLSTTWTSSTKYFFDNCICPIIGVTGTKGKGTTCSMITAILESIGKTVHLVGNIGTPAISELDSIQPDDVVVYELSSFQLWDLHVSPTVAVILRIEPDHLNVHTDFAEYVEAKSHIAAYQSQSDSCIYFQHNESSAHIAELSPAHKFPYPLSDKPNILVELLDSLNVPGEHNRENAEAALIACSAYLKLPLEDFLTQYHNEIHSALANFHGLPHRLEFLRELNNVRYYDDNFSTGIASTSVAINAFPNDNVVAIIGGRDKTDYADLPDIAKLLDSPQVKKVILIGESGHKLYADFPSSKFILAESLQEAIHAAKAIAESLDHAVVLMSPAAASFDMFQNVYDRGAQFASLVKSL